MKNERHWTAETIPPSPVLKRIPVVCLVTQSCLTLWNPTDSSVHQAPLSMGLSRPEYWSGLPCPPPGDLPNPGIEPMVLRSPALAGRLFSTSSTRKALTKRSTRQNSREFCIIFQNYLKPPYLHLHLIKNLCFSRLILLCCVLTEAQGNHIWYCQ